AERLREADRARRRHDAAPGVRVEVRRGDRAAEAGGSRGGGERHPDVVLQWPAVHAPHQAGVPRLLGPGRGRVATQRRRVGQRLTRYDLGPAVEYLTDASHAAADVDAE